MKMRLLFAGGLMLALTGCATYDYVGGGRGGGYYHGAPSTEYRYPYGYPYDSGYPYYGGYGYYGYGNPYYSRPVYRPPPHNHRPPPRPGNGGENRPPPPPRQNNGGSPWRNLDSMRRPPQADRPSGPPQARPSAPPQARPAAPPQARPAPAPRAPRSNGSPWRNLER
ncbi:hypothetical protein [Stenotrophomonas sp.]|uniref:hypothetical protein n=1 Tax=Stenotrophomonas sp. TaxID=69392 RepID=UPI00289D37ED|nr:hypothetical protein [Stenotrophomonas sp.]